MLSGILTGTALARNLAVAWHGQSYPAKDSLILWGSRLPPLAVLRGGPRYTVRFSHQVVLYSDFPLMLHYNWGLDCKTAKARTRRASQKIGDPI
jgi:hypothetical protein